MFSSLSQKAVTRWLWPFAGVLLLAISTLWFWPLSTTSRGPVELEGIVQAQEVKPASLLGGRVQTILVEEGQAVKKGDVLLVFDRQELESRIKQAKAQLWQAKAKEALIINGSDPNDLKAAQEQVTQASKRLALLQQGASVAEVEAAEAQHQQALSENKAAKQRYQQAKEGLEQGLIAKQQFTQVEQALEQAKQQLRAAEAKLRDMRAGPRQQEVQIAESQVRSSQAAFNQLKQGPKPAEAQIQKAQVQSAQYAVEGLEAQKQEVEVKAPMDGIVSLLLVSPGELVAPGAPVAAVTDNQHLWTDVFVPESMLPHIRVGQVVWGKATVFPKERFKAHIATISPNGAYKPSAASQALGRKGEATYRVKVIYDDIQTASHHNLLDGMNIKVLIPAEPAVSVALAKKAR